jgi:hypothetical protein
MKINYVISTYNGANTRKHSNPFPKDVLSSHLRKLNSLDHSLSQITIVKPQSEELFKDYYAIEEKFNIPVNFIECENYGYSGGQFLKAYEIYQDKFDYYIFIEDDYCAGMDLFDNILIKCYQYKFSDNVGILCSLVQGSKNYSKGGYPTHWEGVAFMSSKTLKTLYSSKQWKGDPRKWLNKIDNLVDSNFNWQSQKDSYMGGYYQLTFSHLFTLSNIEHKDYLDVEYNNYNLQFPYWSDLNNTIGGKISFYNPGDVIRDNYILKDIRYSPFIPIQLSTEEGIHANSNLQDLTNMPKIIFLIGMHRSGTSLLSNCLIESGFEIGTNKNQDKNWQNPNGYFENDSFHDFHNELLHFNNCSWDNLKPIKMKYTEDHVKRYRKLIKSEFNSNKILIKDPRLTFFQDFLKDVCKDLYEYYFVFCTRDEKECTISLSKAQNITKFKSENLYNITHKFIPTDCLIVDHKKLIYDNKLTLHQISDFCDFKIINDTTSLVDLKLYRNKNK